MHSSMHFRKITVGPADLRERDWRSRQGEEGVVIRPKMMAYESS